MIGHITQFHAMSKKVRAKNVSVAVKKLQIRDGKSENLTA